MQVADLLLCGQDLTVCIVGLDHDTSDVGAVAASDRLTRHSLAASVWAVATVATLKPTDSGSECGQAVREGHV